MFKLEQNFERKNNIENSKIVQIVENARESLFDLNSVFYKISLENIDLFNLESPLGKSLLRLNDLSIKTNKLLTSPRFVLSTLGTTSSGKSTFVNGLLGTKLAPMDADELSAGTLRFNFNDDYKSNSKITITCNDPNDYWDNGIFENSNENIYTKAFHIMETYRDKSKNETLSVPEISIESSFLIGQKPRFLGLDNNAIVEILDLPGLRTISDKENLQVIQDNVRASFIIFILDYSKLFDTESKKLLYEELKEIKKSVGSDVTMLFVLNKVDLRNEDDKELKSAITKTQIEIKENLNLDLLPDVVPFDSLLFYRINSAYLAYIHLESIESSLEEIEYYKKQIKNNLKSCFKDCAKQIAQLKEQDDNWTLISDTERLVFKNDLNIPNFENFVEFWKLCSEKSGANNLFQKIMERTENSLRELILYPTLQKYLIESEKFLNLLDNTIKVAKVEDINQIEVSKIKLIEIEKILKNTIISSKEKIRKKVSDSLTKIQSSSAGQRLEGLKSLKLEEVAYYVKGEVIDIVNEHTIEAIKDFIINETMSEKVKNDLIEKFHWSPEVSSKLINFYDFVRRKLYNEKKNIYEGKTFEYLYNDHYEEEKIQEISTNIDHLCEYVEIGIINHIDLEMQRSINDLSSKVKNWIYDETNIIHKDIIKLISAIDNTIELPSIKENYFLNTDYQGFSLGKKHLLDSSKKESSKSETILSGTRTEYQEIIEPQDSFEKTTERRWYTLWLYKHETTVPKVKYVSKYVPKEVPVYTTQNKKTVQFSSVEELTAKWQHSLFSLENDLWKDICENLKNLLENALDSYEVMILEVTQQINSVLNQKEVQLKKAESETKLKWDKITSLYEDAINKHEFLLSLTKSHKE